MEFTYEWYKLLLNELKVKNYVFSKFNDRTDNRQVILRHDVDMSLDAAVEFAKLEKQSDVISTYFILASTDFYNIFSKSSTEKLKIILGCGHEIGLHFDEAKYECKTVDDIKEKIFFETEILSNAIGHKVDVVSMHRPSKLVLDNDIHIDGMVNSYSKEFFSKYKYVSDSRMSWREDVIQIIETGEYDKLQILTHPFWYKAKQQDMKKILKDFIIKKKNDVYDSIDENFRDLHDVILKQEIREV